MATVEDLQSSLDRAKEKLQENSYTLSENDKEIAKLNTDVEAVSAAYCNYAGYVSIIMNNIILLMYNACNGLQWPIMCHCSAWPGTHHYHFVHVS